MVRKMAKKTIHFIGLLANVDSTILNIHLDHNFSIEEKDQNLGVDLISSIEGAPFEVVAKKIFEYWCFTPKQKIYFIANSFDVEIEETAKPIVFHPEVMEFNNQLVDNYLKPKIRLMRLFKEGNICMPLTYYYLIDEDTPKSIMGWSAPLPASEELYTLEQSEVPTLLAYIQDTELPLSKSFLQLAFENFELSYQTVNINLSFLCLMISLETLFNPGRQELRYRISRNAAVLFGANEAHSKKIFSEIRDLYDKRSKIVHTGRSQIINREDLTRLRYYVRESIKKIKGIDKDKDELMEVLTSTGFGQRI